MSVKRFLTCLLCLVSATAVLPLAAAPAGTLTVGVEMSMSGQFANNGLQIKRGIELYMAQHGDTAGGRAVRVVYRDTKGISPQLAERTAKELILNDKASVLAGFDLSPNAFAVAPVATKTKVPMIVMTAATSSITEKSPYIVRTSMTMAQGSWAMATWAYKDGIRRVYVLVAGFDPGYAAQSEFTKVFTSLGGRVVGSVRTPVDTTDYSSYLLKAEASKPGALFIFVPPSGSLVALVKNIHTMALQKHGIKIIGLGDIVDESFLPAEGRDVAGYITAFQYSADHASPENRKFVEAFEKAYGSTPNFQSVAGYDGMALLYKVLAKTHGVAAGPAFVSAAEGLSWNSPRGPIEIDPKTRDITQNEYIRRTELVGGKLENVEFYTFPMVKDPAKGE